MLDGRKAKEHKAGAEEAKKRKLGAKVVPQAKDQRHQGRQKLLHSFRWGWQKYAKVSSI
jgi:hypothetical protein